MAGARRGVDSLQTGGPAASGAISAAIPMMRMERPTRLAGTVRRSIEGASPSGGNRLPPMAPRVVLRQSHSAPSAVEAVPGADTVQRAWQAALVLRAEGDVGARRLQRW